ncbi:Rap1a/Tai family immunity protein [Azospirillum isscasi]|uniref:Rap1a/Tai family immunity protein n=1 Tax=Azospirillum isscasi TaxID=3053926 RepID=A0ABU0WAF9_9PROT|nr:Rap1a/Tai family immunity protein [Azospirillum isscasi]MDQ2101165.1 Rap1a/Tai family immunity protein [Azospirillum isscasi]
MTMRLAAPFAALLAAGLASAAVTAAFAQTTGAPPDGPSQTVFQVRTTGDLVRLCEAVPNTTTGIAALHFCHGFAVGAYQYHQIVSAAENKRPLFCPPNPQPSRDEAIAGFIGWAQKNPSQMETPPVEGMFRYLAQRYPCRA